MPYYTMSGSLTSFEMWLMLHDYNSIIKIEATKKDIYVLRWIGLDKVCWKLDKYEQGKGWESLESFNQLEYGKAIETFNKYIKVGLSTKEKQSGYTCPLCSGAMSAKEGKFGTFYSCSNWNKNKCPATLNADGIPSKKTKALMSHKIIASPKPKTNKDDSLKEVLDRLDVMD